MSPQTATADAHPSPLDEGTAAPDGEAADATSFLALYEAQFAFVWRSVRRLGVDDGALDDVVQEVFVVVHRRLATFERRSSIKTWLFGIVLHVVRDHRRTLRRKRPKTEGDVELVVDDGATPYESLEKAQAVHLLHALLDTLDDDKRAVFVLAELEQLTAPEIAEATGTNVNTVYARLRAARKSFDAAVARHRARTVNGRTS